LYRSASEYIDKLINIILQVEQEYTKKTMTFGCSGIGSTPILQPALQRHSTENTKQIFPEKELRRLSPNFHIHVLVSD
jgi:hypothetical protein